MGSNSIAVFHFYSIDSIMKSFNQVFSQGTNLVQKSFYTAWWGVFRTLPNIWDVVRFVKSSTLVVWLGSEYASGMPNEILTCSFL